MVHNVSLHWPLAAVIAEVVIFVKLCLIQQVRDVGSPMDLMDHVLIEYALIYQVQLVKVIVILSFLDVCGMEQDVKINKLHAQHIQILVKMPAK